MRRHSDGSPYLVEELLAGLVSSGELRFEDGRWTSAGHLTPTVPASLRESIHRRLGVARPRRSPRAGGGRAARSHVRVGAAARASRRSTGARRWTACGPPSTSSSSRSTAMASRSATPSPAKRCCTTCSRPSGATSPLGRGRCTSGPTLGCPGRRSSWRPSWPRRRASRWPPRATSSRAHAARWTTAPSPRRRRPPAEPPVWPRATRRCAFDAGEVLVHVLVAAGKPGEALAVGHDLAARFEASDAPAARRADLLVVTARAALATGDGRGAADDAAAALAAAGADVDAGLARSPGRGCRRASPSTRSISMPPSGWREAAVEGASATGQPAVECEALMVVGAVVRTIDGMDASLPLVRAGGGGRRGGGPGPAPPARPARAGPDRVDATATCSPSTTSATRRSATAR